MIDRITRRKNIQRSALVLAATCSLFPHMAHAQSSPRGTVDISMGGEGSTNPFSQVNGEGAFAFVVSVDPRLVWQDERSTVSIDSNFRYSQYLDTYGSDEAGRVAGAANQQLSERTSVFARAGFQTSRSSVRDSFFRSTGDPFDPDFVPEIPLSDVSVLGRRTRVNTLDASGGIAHVLGPSDSIAFSISGSRSTFSDITRSDYRTGSANMQYSRRLSERTSIIGSLGFTLSDYLSQRDGDAKIVSPQIGVEHQLNERVSINASAGVSYAIIDQGVGSSNKSTYFSGSFSICDRGVRSTLCASASRGAGPTALGGVSSSTIASIKYDLAVTPKDRVSVSARYGRTNRSSDPIFGLQQGSRDIIGVQGTYSREINERLSLDVTPSYSKIYEPGLQRDSNFSAIISLRLRLGKLR